MNFVELFVQRQSGKDFPLIYCKWAALLAIAGAVDRKVYLCTSHDKPLPRRLRPAQDHLVVLTPLDATRAAC